MPPKTKAQDACDEAVQRLCGAAIGGYTGAKDRYNGFRKQANVAAATMRQSAEVLGRDGCGQYPRPSDIS